MASLTSGTKTPHDASFSSYLDNGGETYIHKLVGLTQNLSLVSTTEDDHIFSIKKKSKDGEIDVFSADKYFSGRIDGDKSVSKTSTADLGARRTYHNKTEEEMVGIRGGYSNSRPRTPSVYSESSWNSQNALIRRRPVNSSRSQIRASNKRFFSNLRCRCSCLDKDSADVCEDHLKDNHSHSDFDIRMVTNGLGHHERSINSGTMKTSLEPADLIRINKLGLDNYYPRSNNVALGLIRDSPFALPVSDSPSITILPSHKVQQSLQEGYEEKPRKSLEVFGSPMMQDKGGSQSFNLEKRWLNMKAWDAIPQAEEMQIQGPKHSCETIKDTESDASSDLFEIECLSCSANSVILPRQPSERTIEDNFGGISTSLYAPSEASVDWSVVTASMAEFSAVSDSEDQARSTIMSEKSNHRMGAKGNNYNVSNDKRPMVQNKQQKKRSSGGGLLLGCKSQKSLRVAGDVYKTTGSFRGEVEESQRVDRLNSYTRTARFQPDAKLSGFGSKRRTDLVYIQ